MGIKDPGTYGEWYWKTSTEATMYLDDEREQILAPIASQFFGTLPAFDKLPPPIQSLLNQLMAPESFAWGALLTSVGGNAAGGVMSNALGTMLKPFNYEMNQILKDTRLEPLPASQLFQRKKIDEEYWMFCMSSAGYDEATAKGVYMAGQPYPSITDLITWARYEGDPDNTWSTLFDVMDINPTDFKIWDWLGRQRLTTQQVQRLYTRGYLGQGDADLELARIGWLGVDIDLVRELSYLYPNAMLQVQGDVFNRVREDDILNDIIASDIHPDYAKKYLDAVLTKPSSQDIIAYQLRLKPDLSDLPGELERIGIHPHYTELYKTLAYQIPPVADIITMAVREAFTPSIARRFGQYEDFPPDFEKYAAMKGLSKEWAERYWAAHWSLPSSQQGFEMLHRGIIDERDLDTLLRALDIMPFWRSRLTEMAFKPLTRVDVRRMYKEGVLDEREVFQAYLDLGYNDENAERMAEFTVKQTLSSLAKFTSGDVVKAYTQRMISRSEANGLLRDLDIRPEDARYILETADYKREWEYTEERIKGIKNMYKRGVYDENQTRSELNRLNLPADQQDILMEQWYYEEKEKERPTWTTAQTISFWKSGKIDEPRARRELNIIGYDEEHINVYLSK